MLSTKNFQQTSKQVSASNFNLIFLYRYKLHIAIYETITLFSRHSQCMRTSSPNRNAIFQILKQNKLHFIEDYERSSSKKVHVDVSIQLEENTQQGKIRKEN